MDPALLWLWHRPAAIALLRPLAWELPYAVGGALEKAKRQEKKKTQQAYVSTCATHTHIHTHNIISGSMELRTLITKSKLPLLHPIFMDKGPRIRITTVPSSDGESLCLPPPPFCFVHHPILRSWVLDSGQGLSPCFATSLCDCRPFNPPLFLISQNNLPLGCCEGQGR